MTGDDLISMHKAIAQVVEDMTHLDTGRGDLQGSLIALRQSILALATVQRDILAGTLQAVLGEGS